MQTPAIDSELLGKFDSEIWTRLPRAEGERIVGATPLVDITSVLVDCAREEYGITLDTREGRVFAKFDSKISGGSVKARAAGAIIRDAIVKGNLSRGKTVFEATSGNFGLALGMIRSIGLDVVALISRRLQDGVVDSLKASGVRTINLDVDICPAPGVVGSADRAVAKGTRMSVRQQLGALGFELSPFDEVEAAVEELLMRQDVIGLAKLLARVYGGYCTEQYDNSLSVGAHQAVTAPELDQQLSERGASLGGVEFVCAFGTGGTAGGMSRYMAERHGKKGVRVVFPLDGQDVAGIRTKSNAVGLKFYEPESYIGEHQVDFEEASRLFGYFNSRGFDVGESGALVLYACMQLINFGTRTTYVAMIADGSSKYAKEVRGIARKGKRDQVRLDEAVSSMQSYGGVLWAHNAFVPRAEGVSIIASSLGCDESAVRVAKTGDVQALLNGTEPSPEFKELLPRDGKPILVVCMAGATSLMLAKVLGKQGVAAESLVGGITGLPSSRTKSPSELVQISR